MLCKPYYSQWFKIATEYIAWVEPAIRSGLSHFLAQNEPLCCRAFIGSKMVQSLLALLIKVVIEYIETDNIKCTLIIRWVFVPLSICFWHSGESLR